MPKLLMILLYSTYVLSTLFLGHNGGKRLVVAKNKVVMIEIEDIFQEYVSIIILIGGLFLFPGGIKVLTIVPALATIGWVRFRLICRSQAKQFASGMMAGLQEAMEGRDSILKPPSTWK